MSVPPADDAGTSSLFVPIVYGNVAVPLKDIPEFANANPDFTHKWTLYLRGLDPGLDLSQFIAKVVFKLHESFAIPVRIIESPPFEITELGWGEFEVVIKVHLKDPFSKPLQLLHFLRLYPVDDTLNVLPIPLPFPAASVVSEAYDEIVINSISLKTMLRNAGLRNITTLSKLDPSSPYAVAERDELERLRRASASIEKEIEKIRERKQHLTRILANK